MSKEDNAPSNCPDQVSSNKRIAKNTLMLYLRMLLSMVVGLYTSRIVLDVLGINDYGINVIVGSVTAFISFFNSTLGGATSRFIIYELGRSPLNKVREIFSTAFIAHICLAVILVVLGETVGLWFLENELVIPEERLFAARWVYHLSLCSMFISIISTPYYADVIANERMSIYAYTEIVNVTLKLVIVYMLMLVNCDKLILYSSLFLIVTVIVFFIYKIYCNVHFPESKLVRVCNRDSMAKILSFSGYNFLGNAGFAVNTQGINFLINMFFGVCYNAAVGISNTVSGAVNAFVSNINTAIRPVIIKEYASGNIEQMRNYINVGIKLSIFLIGCVAIPIILNVNYVLTLWLKNVPPMASVFTCLIILDILFVNGRYVYTIGIHAVGRVKANSLINGMAYLCNPAIIYILYKLGSPVYTAFVSLLIVDMLLCISSTIILRNLVPNICWLKMVGVFAKSLIIMVLVYVISFLIIRQLENEFEKLALSVVLSISIMSIGNYALNMERRSRQVLLRMITNRIRWRKSC